MKTLKILSFGLLILSATVFTSCKKEGCTDSDSINYDADAKTDDASCQYEGRVVFWYNQAVADFLIADGATALTYYVDGVVVGSSAASVYWTGAPDCGQNGSMTVTKALGNVKNKSYTYSVKDQTGFEYYTNVINFEANTCVALQLN